MSEKKFINFSGQYNLDSLEESQIDPNPINQFKYWFAEICEKGVDHPEAMNIATASKEGRISSRIVLMKTIEEDGIIFFTNYESHKAKEMEINPFIAANLLDAVNSLISFKYSLIFLYIFNLFNLFLVFISYLFFSKIC